MRPDSSLIDAAIVARLANDAELQSYMPDGVYFDEAPPDKRNFVIVSLSDHRDVPSFDGREAEDSLYLIKGVSFGTSGSAVKAAAYRIDQLLEDHALAVAGYGCVALTREKRIRYPEVDDLDPNIRWQHRGGQYRVQMAPIAAS